MALTTTITKKSVSCSQEGVYQITLNMKYQNDAVVLLDQDFTEYYKSIWAPAKILPIFREKMKEAIKRYKAEQAILTSAALDNAVTNLNSTVGV